MGLTKGFLEKPTSGVRREGEARQLKMWRFQAEIQVGTKPRVMGTDHRPVRLQLSPGVAGGRGCLQRGRGGPLR